MKAKGKRTRTSVKNDLTRARAASGQLDERYRAMALDEARELEAREWSEGLIGDCSADEPRSR